MKQKEQQSERLNETSDQSAYIKMDYTLSTPEERVAKVEEIIAATPPEKLNSFYLQKMADYILQLEKGKKENLITNNRTVTINNRETSFEGLVSRLENGENGIYNMIANDKNIIFSAKVEITEEDVAAMPELKELRAGIDKLEEESKNARGKRAYELKCQIRDLRKDQYVIKNSYKKPIYSTNPIKSVTKLDLIENAYVDDADNIVTDAQISLLLPEHISAILCNYEKLIVQSRNKIDSDIKWFLLDLDNLIAETLKKDYPIYYDIVKLKISGEQNDYIQEYIAEKHGIKHSVEYISSLWRNKIPLLLAKREQEKWLYWYFTIVERGVWKKCSKCGEIKPAHIMFFSKNKTSKDGYYSVCKDCRRTK